MDALNRSKEELETKLRAVEQKLAEALNAQDEFARMKRDLENRLDDLMAKNQKLKDELDDVKIEAEKEIQKWKNEAFSARSDLKTMETNLANLKNQLNSANERNETLNKTVTDHISKIRDCKNFGQNN